MEKKSTHQALQKRIKELETQARKKTFSEQLTRTLFDISEAVNTTTDLNALYASIYRSLDRLMGLPNFFIAIYEKEANKIRIPFFVDQFDKYSDYEDRFTEKNTLTGEVLKRKKPLFLTESRIKKRAEKGKIMGTIPRIWLGVPLNRQQGPIGVLAVQSYDDPGYFTRKDLEVLVTVSHQIALAIERRQSLDELETLRNYLYNIINSMPSILIGLDRKGTVTQWNSQAELETGIKAADAVGKPLGRVFPRLNLNMGQIMDSIQHNKIRTSLKQEYFNGKERRYEDIIIYPIVTNGVEGVVIRMDDITDQVRMEEMMIQSEKMLSIGGLAAGMAHEINNPLAGMMQNAQVIYNRIAKDLPDNKKAARELGISMKDIRAYMERREILRKLEMINETGNRAAVIIKNMLGFARKSDAVIEPHDLAKLIRKTLDLARSDYNLKKHYDFKLIDVVEEFDPIAPVRCDSGKLQQVILNIFKNGAEAMAEKKQDGYHPCFTLRIYRQDRMACMEIEDNGPGMDEDMRKRMFEPFYTTKPVGEGTGLGLSVSYFIIVKDHKGELAVESRKGLGTKFIIKLPY